MFDHRFRIAAVLCVLVATMFLAPAAHATWSQSGNLVAGSSSDDFTGLAWPAWGSTIAPDGTGGLFVVYATGSNADSIRINRINGDTGDRMWGTNGIKVNEGGNALDNGNIRVAPDGAGGCWVVWEDSRSAAPGIYVERFGSDGVAKSENVGGFRIHDASAFDPVIAASGNSVSEVLIAYWVVAGGLQLQKVHMQGNNFLPFVLYGANATMTTDAGSSSVTPIQIWADDTGGGYVLWHSNRASLPGTSTYSRIVANRFDSSGNPQWGAQGAVVEAGAGVTAVTFDSYYDGTSLYAVWRHEATTSGIHAQKLNSSGVAQWGSTATGTTVMDWVSTPWQLNSTTDQQPRIQPAASGGVWVAWLDGRDWNRPGPNGFLHDQDIYVQRLNSSGTRQLAANGAPVDTTTGSDTDLRALPGASGELLIACRSWLFDNGDIMLTRVNTSGAMVSNDFLNKSGSLSVNDDVQQKPVMAPDGSGGAFVAWDDNRATPNQDVYTSHRSSTLALGGPTIALTFPNGGETLPGLKPVDITWTSTLPALASVKLEFSNGGFTRTTIVSGTPNDGAFTWTPPFAPSSAMKVYVSEATDGAPADSSNALFSICAPLDSLTSYGTFAGPNDVALADVNGDGILDVLVSATAGVWILPGHGTVGVGDGTFGAASLVSLAPSSARDLGTGDFDGDGIPDIAVSVSTGVRILRGGGVNSVPDGTFTAGTTYATGGTPRGVTVADFNDDGILDLAILNATSNNVSILLGQGANGVGDGTFAAAVNYATGTNPSRAIAGDFNEDDILDLAIANNSSNTISILLGQGVSHIGNGTFAAAVNYATGAGPIGIASGDFNSDGIVDLATAGTSGASILIGQGAAGVGNGTFAAATTVSVGSTARDVGVADFNSDGRADLAVAVSGTDGVALLYGNGTGNTGDGTFTLAGQIPSGDFPTQLAIGDLKGDNAPDVVVVHSNSGTAAILAAECPNTVIGSMTMVVPTGTTNWTPGTLQTILWARGGALATDVQVSRDAGAHWTTIAADRIGTSFSWYVTGPGTGNGRVRVRDTKLLNHVGPPNGTVNISAVPLVVTSPNGGETVRSFQPTPITWTNDLISPLELDYSISGVFTTITGAAPNTGSFTWYPPDVATTAARVRVIDTDGVPSDLSNADFTICRSFTASSVASATGARPMVRADFNNDGIQDLVDGESGVAMHLGGGSVGVGNGTFGVAIVSASGATCLHLATGDFSGDGVLDLVTDQSGALQILRQNTSAGTGTGSFIQVLTLPSLANPGAMVVADFNEDGFPDIAAVVPASNTVEVYLGAPPVAGLPAFLPRVDYGVSLQPSDLVAADFNNDGITDLALACTGVDGVSVMLGRGTGGVGNGDFHPNVVHLGPVGSAPTSIVATDIDRDGDLDVVTDGALPARYLNPGTGVLSGGVTFPRGSGTVTRLAAADFDGDGFEDLLATGDSPDDLRVVIRDSPDSYTLAGSLAVGVNPQGLATGDFDGNGVLDVAVTNSGSSQISVFRGNACGIAFGGSVTLTSPNGGESLVAGANQTITWTRGGSVGLVNLEITRDNGAHWLPIASHVPGTSLVWTVTPAATAGARIRVSDANVQSRSDASDAVFTISVPGLTVTSPNGGETLTGFAGVPLTWSSSSFAGNVKLEYTIDGGPRQLIAASTPNDGSEVFAVPNIATTGAKVFVSDAADGTPSDSSNAGFAICARLDPPVATPAGGFTAGIVTGDFNADGITDLLARAAGHLEVLLGAGTGGVGNGAFLAATAIPTPATGEALVAADFNGDGITDAAAVSDGGVVIHLGTGASGSGDGGFGAGTLVAVPGSGGGRIVAGDFDEDGITDLALSDPVAGKLHILRGNGSGGVGDGTFSAPASFTLGATPGDLTLGDFNADGILDLAVTQPSAGNVRLAIGNGSGGNGDGTFTLGATFATAAGHGEIVATDANHDGALDLVTTGLTGGTVACLIGNGAGSFAAALSSPLAADSIRRLAVADVDYDNVADLVLTAGNLAGQSPQVLVMHGNGDGSFTSRGGTPVGGAPLGLALGDFDEDGVFDLAVTSGLPSGAVQALLGAACGLDPSGSVTLVQPGPQALVAGKGGDAIDSGPAWTVGSEHLLQWSKTGHVLAVNLEVSRDNGRHWQPIAGNLPGTSYAWTVTPPVTDSLRLKVADAASSTRTDQSVTPVQVVSGSTAVGGEDLPVRAAFSSPWPNPTRGSALFELALPRAADVTIEAFDIHGRVVATLARESMNAGRHLVRWNPGAGRESATPAGVYFVRARWAGFQAVRRVVRVE